ncbi:MAG: hypothetical protein AAB518_03745 [Patescibacteria group bacterium]
MTAPWEADGSDESVGFRRKDDELNAEEQDPGARWIVFGLVVMIGIVLGIVWLGRLIYFNLV